MLVKDFLQVADPESKLWIFDKTGNTDIGYFYKDNPVPADLYSKQIVSIKNGAGSFFIRLGE